MLHIENLTYRIAGRAIFEGASVSVPAGHKVGLVGRNGSGKTTLFGLILGVLHADDGIVRVRRGAHIGSVAQEAPSGTRSLLETVLAADTERASLLAEAETAADVHRIAEIHTRLADIDSHTAPSRAAAILAGLGFDEETQQRPCAEFSGGWRMRVALAAALFARADLLLLDEPTNHLDLEATLWLESYLASWRGTLVIISHDRALLNGAVDGIIHVDKGGLTRYAGNYDRFERTRRERLMQQDKMREKQELERKHIQSFVDRFRYTASKARQAQSRLKMLARMEPIATVIEDKTTVFEFPVPKELPPPMITMDDVCAGYEADKPVLSGLNLRIDMEDRIALLGANGNGKSTLVKMLAGRLAPLSGRITRHGSLKVGYFAQHQTDELHADESPFQHMARAMEGSPQSKVRAHLGRFGFFQQRADTLAGDLSGGEKARLLFALMSISTPHILLLDEPTNHLDVDAREALVRALNDFQGAVVLVSHDPHLIELVSDRLWLVDDGTCKTFDGDLDDYRNLLLEKRRQGRREQRNGNQSTANRKDARRERAKARADNAVMRKTAKDAEKQLEKLNRQKAALEARLADPAVFGGPTGELQALGIKLADLNKTIAGTEQAWLATLEALEGEE
ncbi:MAG: glycosyl transferase family 1 [Rhodospirillales bacterium RIFCSPLOWO2_12_FULL_58_28]|nr:MAG: glycosyl transferase family 1 [Rhodospirillales bacterium RIFCSPLOWO2_02_FULL_58_16]OHC78551.1 MAG: glycosyl transferase family 1 [Rhodospirillales bacterium RIFCSPLOWO2_12_FULL_58_28]